MRSSLSSESMSWTYWEGGVQQMADPKMKRPLSQAAIDDAGDCLL